MPSRGTFNFSTLHATIPMTYAEFKESHDVFFEGNNLKSNVAASDPTQLAKHIVNLGQVEHEYFHCRNFLSTAFGLFAHTLAVVEQDQKEYFIENCLSRDVFVTPMANVLSTGAFNRFRYSANCQSSILHMIFWTSLRRYAFDPNSDSLVSLRQSQRWLAKTGSESAGEHVDRLIHLDLEFPRAPIFRNIRRAKSKRNQMPWPSALQILEGLAVWKEFMYVSTICAPIPDHFFDLTDSAIERLLTQNLYSAVPNLILKSTGCGLSAALPGVILDLALCGPLFSFEAKSWSELHPGGRLLAMLSISSELPAHLRKPTNFEILGDNFFIDTARFFERRLGWTSFEDNISSALAFLNAETEAAYGAIGNAVNDDMRRLDLGQFRHALQERLSSPSMFVLNGRSEKIESVGYLTQPPVTHFIDGIYENILIREARPDLTIMRFKKIVLTLACADLVDEVTGEGPERFREARAFADAARVHLGVKWPDAENAFPRFEEMMSGWLGFDWSDACRERSENLKTISKYVSTGHKVR